MRRRRYPYREKVPAKSELPHQQAATPFYHEPPAATSFFEYLFFKSFFSSFFNTFFFCIFFFNAFFFIVFARNAPPEKNTTTTQRCGAHLSLCGKQCPLHALFFSIVNFSDYSCIVLSPRRRVSVTRRSLSQKKMVDNS